MFCAVLNSYNFRGNKMQGKWKAQSILVRSKKYDQFQIVDISRSEDHTPSLEAGRSKKMCKNIAFWRDFKPILCKIHSTLPTTDKNRQIM